jgi:NitT/TauT family transport system permease protein
VLVFGLLWQLLADRHFVRPEYFPTATTTVREAFVVLGQHDFRTAIVTTIRETLEGLAIATAIAVPAGVVIGRSRHVYRSMSLVIELLRPVSAVALAPLAILVFKTGLAPVIFLVVWTSVWPVLINTIYGMRDLDPVAHDTARVFGFGRLAILCRVAFPNAASYIATGIRISTGIALAVAIAGEIVAGGGQGIGGWINRESAAGSLVPVYAGALVVGVIGYLLNVALERIERRLLHWHESLRTEHAR